jgi:SAM-dependent methyltransferase
MDRTDNDSGTHAKATYDAFASSYDDFNHRYMYERWTGKLLGVAEAAGLQGNRLLDVGCGTGLSFVSMLDRGFEVTGCDISPEMLARARERAGDRAILVEADARDLPELGSFDLVWAVNDAMNYLLTEDDLAAALTGMRRNLAPDGLVVFDVNTLEAYRTFFGGRTVVERGGRRFVWEGTGDARAEPGGTFQADFGGDGEGVVGHSHLQRHFDKVELLAAIGASGLRAVEMLGERDGELERGIDETTHTKSVYVCRAMS